MQTLEAKEQLASVSNGHADPDRRREERHKDRHKEKDRNRDRDKDKHKSDRKDRHRDRDKDKDREKDRDRERHRCERADHQMSAQTALEKLHRIVALAPHPAVQCILPRAAGLTVQVERLPSSPEHEPAIILSPAPC